MRILLIGAGGYLGSALAACLRERGHELIALARTPDRAAALAAWGLAPLAGDLAGDTGWHARLGEIDAVVFAPALRWDAEWPAMKPILDRMSGKTFLMTSGTAVLSLPVQDGAWREESFAEDDPFTPSEWATVRVETERRLLARGDVRAMIVRPPMIWGNGGSYQIPAFFESAARTGSVAYVGAGLNLYSNVHVDDLAALFALALERGRAGGVYHAVGGEAAWRVIAEAVARTMGVEARSIGMDEAEALWGKWTARIYYGVSSRSRCPRSRAELGWAPRRLDLIEDIRNGSYREAWLAGREALAETGRWPRG